MITKESLMQDLHRCGVPQDRPVLVHTSLKKIGPVEGGGETVLAVYHSNSAGKTQSAETLWGTEIPYLTSVESPGDKLSPDYISVAEFTAQELEVALKEFII